jgi:hypothetical protein
MSGSRSIYGFASRVDRAAMSADHPISALTTLLHRNNTQHLVDQSVQYRINWCASTSSSEYGSSGEAAARAQYCCEFPVTITDQEALPNFDLSVGVRLTGTLTTASLSATIAPTTNAQALSLKSWSISTATATWYDHTFDLSARKWGAYKRRLAYPADWGGGPQIAATPRSYVMLSLNVIATSGNISLGNCQIVGIDLREAGG